MASATSGSVRARFSIMVPPLLPVYPWLSSGGAHGGCSERRRGGVGRGGALLWDLQGTRCCSARRRLTTKVGPGGAPRGAPEGNHGRNRRENVVGGGRDEGCVAD